MTDRKLNNSGASLVLVLVCLLFVGIIASSILLIVRGNLSVSQTDRKMSENFYSAEESADKVRAILQEYADLAVNKSYTRWLQQYSVGEQSVGNVFDRLFAEDLLDVLLEDLVFGTPTAAVPVIDTEIDAVTGDTVNTITYSLDISLPGENADSRNGKVKDLPTLIQAEGSSPAQWANDRIEIEIEEVIKADSLTADDREVSIRIKDLSIVYTDSDGTNTVITTDLVFSAKAPSFSVNTVKGQNLNSSEYAVIANGTILNNGFLRNADGTVIAEGVAIDLTVDGDIYGGSGITFGNGNVKINAEKIVTRKDFVVSDSAKAVLKGVRSEYGFATYADLWADNILVANKGRDSSGGTIELQGIAYVADDLTLEDHSKFVLKGEKSAFYGYSTNNAASYRSSNRYSSQYNVGTPDGSSAIVINGNNAVLDMSEAQQAWIAGKAFVNVASVVGGVKNNSDKAFMEGESVSYRGQQSAYLVPGECIKGIGHNPMTATEFYSIVDSAAITGSIVNPNEIARGAVDLSLAKLSIADYVDAVLPYRPAFVHYGGTDLVYLYLNFKNADMASKYYSDYAEVYPELVQGRMDSFGEGEIRMPAMLINTGNVLTYSGGSASILSKNYSYSDSLIINKQIELSSKFSGLCSGLNEFYGGRAEKVTDSIVNLDAMSAAGSKLVISDSETGLEEYSFMIPDSIIISGHYSDVTGGFSFKKPSDSSSYRDIADAVYVRHPELENYTLFLARGDVNIISNGWVTDCGVIICGGDVTIDAGAGFKGTIICGGDVIIKGNSTLTADSRNVSTLIKSSRLLNELFLLSESTGTAKGGQGEDSAGNFISINFENWRKN